MIRIGLSRLPLVALHAILEREEREIVERLMAYYQIDRETAEEHFASDIQYENHIEGIHEDESTMFWQLVKEVRRREREEIARLREECAA